MAQSLLESSALSAFFGGTAVMLSAGIQLDEAVHMLCEDRDDSPFKSLCEELYRSLAEGHTLAESMDMSGAFPEYAVSLVEAGESSGRIEAVLRNLELYYDEEDRMFAKIRTSVGYPAALLCIMSVILAVTVWFILPIFVGVYQNMSGLITAGSFSEVGASIAIGWVALIVTVICAAFVIWMSMMSRSQSGRERLLKLLEKIPATRQAVYQLSLSRFTVALAAHVSSGVSSEEALQNSMKVVTNKELLGRLEAAHDAMTDVSNPRSLAQAISEKEVFDPFYARMLTVSSHSGSMDAILSNLSQTFFDDAFYQIDRVVDGIEPALAAFLTIAVGATLIAVMLPLIGIMRSIG